MTIIIALSLALAATPASEFRSVTEDGAWCWFGDPRAVRHEDTVYAGWVDRQGSIWVAAMNVDSGEIQRTLLHEKLEYDDHNNPSILIRKDDRVMVAWARHGKDDMYLAVSKKPRDISDFGEPRLLKLNSKEANRHVYSGGRDAYTYPSLFAVGKTLYLGWRGLDNKPNLSWSEDGGESWSPGRIYVFPGRTYLNQRPYMKVAAGREGLHFAFTDGHPNREPENGIHYAFLKDGVFSKADGSEIRRLEDAPFGVRDADIVYDARKTKVKSWIWDVAEDADGRPAIVYVRFPTDRDHRYHYARWDGVRWHDHEMVAGGGWFPQTEAGKEEREPNYSGGLVLDHDDPNVVYLSVPVDGVREIQKWSTRDLGKTWKKEPITSRSKRDNIRPFAIRNTPSEGPQVMWMTLNSYTHYTRYDSEIKVDVRE